MEQMDSDELNDRLLTLILEHRAEPQSFTRADMDEIAMIAQACEERLPKRLVGLIRDIDRNFPATTNGRTEFLARAVRIFEVERSLPEQVDIERSDPLLPTFNLSKGDRDRVLKLCSDMRKIIFASADFDEPHKKRLLNRVAAIEAQVLSREGLFDVVLGGVSDIGETLGKFGKNIKPLTDRMTEIAKITRQSTKEYEQIPAPEEIKQLPKPDDE